MKKILKIMIVLVAFGVLVFLLDLVIGDGIDLDPLFTEEEQCKSDGGMPIYKRVYVYPLYREIYVDCHFE